MFIFVLNHIQHAVYLSPTIFRIFLSTHTETLYPLNSNSFSSQPLATTILHFVSMNMTNLCMSQ